jgi:adenylate cyclase
MDVFAELKKRNVFRVAVAYIIASWLILQVSDVVIGNVGAPDWVFKIILMLLSLGLPVVLGFAWAFELTPEGIKLEKNVDRTRSITPQTGRKLNTVTMGLMVLVVIYLVADKFYLRPAEPAPVAATVVAEPAPARPVSVALPPVEQGSVNESIAVLPFVNMSSDPEQEYFSDGITEELLNLLAKIPGFQVAGRTSSFAFKGKNADLREIGESLNVANILEGSVRKSGGQVRITAQLIKVANGYHLWSETYDRQLTDIFTVQDEIAGAVVQALELTLLGDPAGHVVDPIYQNADAHSAYLNGLHLFNVAGPANYLKAQPYFEKAVELSPDSALAWAMLSKNAGWLSGTADSNETDIRKVRLRAREAAARALSLNDSLAEAYNARGSIQTAYDWDWEGAEKSYRKALELEPGSVNALQGLAGLLMGQRRFDEALVYIDQGRRIDPLNPWIQTVSIRGKLEMGRLDEAQQEVTTLLQTVERASWRYWAGLILYYKGQYEEALVQMNQEQMNYRRLVGQAIVNHKMGRINEAQAAQQQLLAQYGIGAAYQHGEIFAQWGDLDTAADWLWTAYNSEDPGIQNLKSDNLLKPLHGHPRYEDLKKRLNFN